MRPALVGFGIGVRRWEAWGRVNGVVARAINLLFISAGKANALRAMMHDA